MCDTHNTLAQRIRKRIDADVIKLQSTESGADIDWPCYCAQVDFIKKFMYAMAGYSCLAQVPDTKQDTLHDLACDFIDKVTRWRKQ